MTQKIETLTKLTSRPMLTALQLLPKEAKTFLHGWTLCPGTVKRAILKDLRPLKWLNFQKMLTVIAKAKEMAGKKVH